MPRPRKNWLPHKKLKNMAKAVQLTFDHVEERNFLCAYINIAAIGLLQKLFPKEVFGLTVGSLAFKDQKDLWSFVFDTQHQNGIFDRRFHLVILHQVGSEVRFLDFTLPYWKSVAQAANSLDADAALIDVARINPKNYGYAYAVEATKYGAYFEQDREQNAIFHKILLPQLFKELVAYFQVLQNNYNRLVSTTGYRNDLKL